MVISARPIASICCSPPDNWLPMFPARSFRRGNSAYTRARVQGSFESLRLAAKATRFSRTVRLGKIWRPSGTIAMPRRAMRSVGMVSMRRPQKCTSPRRTGVKPRIERRVVVLPTPLRPNRVAVSPRSISIDRPKITWLLP